MAEQIRLLHVDDQPDFLDASAQYLERLDDRFEVETATSARDGLEILSDRRIDCVVSDYEMPGTDGIEFLQRVQAEYPRVPFILFTGKGSEEIASEAISAGVTDYLQKRGDREQFELLANRATNAVTGYRAEQDLEQVRDFFTGAERLGDLGAWEVDRHRRLTVTDGVRDILGLDRDADPTVDETIEYVHPADRDRLRAMLGQSTVDSDLDEVELRLTTAAGNRRWVRAGAEQVDTTGDRPLIRGYVQDITDQKRREQDLEAVNQRLRTLISNVPVVLFVIDADGTFTVSEGNGLEKLGFEPGEAEGKTVEGLYGDHESIPDDVHRALSGETVQATYEIGDLWFETTYRPIRQDGEVTGVIGVSMDITERRGREEALTELHDATRRLVDANDPGEIYEILVDTAAQILGFDIVTVDAADDGALRQVASSFDTADTEYYEELSLEDDDTFATRAYRQGETLVIDDIWSHDDVEPADGEYRSVLTIPIGEFGVFQGGSTDAGAFDETDRELAELLVEHARVKLARLSDQGRIRDRTAELERQNERLEEVTNILSHDLRNPLNVAELRLDQARRERDSEHLDTVARSHERMEALIDDLLLLARGGEMVSGVECVDLGSVVEECWETVETGDATLRVATDVVIEADRRRLRQLLENLVGNAVEHGDEGVTVTVERLPDGFAVEDDGPGIPPAERDQVLESGYTTKADGTGFGLAIVDEIASAHGWELSITDGSAGGARFELRGVDVTDAE